MNYFPLFTEIEGKKVVIVGGGRVACHKVSVLKPFGPQLVVIAPEINPLLAEDPDLEIYHREFQTSDLDEASVVIGATDEPAVNQRISEEAISRKIPVNIVDNKALSTFIFPAIYHEGLMTAAFSTAGASPSASHYLKEQIEQIVPDYFPMILQYLALKRETVIDLVPEEKVRAHLFKALFDECMKRERPLSQEEFDEILHETEEKYSD